MKPLLWMRAVRDAEPRFRGKRLPVLWALALRMSPNGQGFASHRVLATDADVSEHTAKRATREAHDRGYLDQTKRGGRRGTGVVVASEWALAEPSQSSTHWPLVNGPQSSKSGSPKFHDVAPQEVLYQEVSSRPHTSLQGRRRSPRMVGGNRTNTNRTPGPRSRR